MAIFAVKMYPSVIQFLVPSKVDLLFKRWFYEGICAGAQFYTDIWSTLYLLC